MRILIVSQYFWPENFRINDLVEELSRRDHSVTVLTGKPNYPEGRIFPEYRQSPEAFSKFGRVPVVRVPIAPRGRSNLALVFNYLSFAISATLLGAWKLRGKSFDAILVFQTSPITAALPAIALGWLKRAPILMWILDLWPDTLSAIGAIKSRRLLGLVGHLVRFIYRCCDLLLIQSRAFESKVVSMGATAGRIRYFPGWAESEFLEQPEVAAAPELLQFGSDFKVLFAGNIGEAQGFSAILDAANLLRDEPRLRWVIVGDGRAAAHVREQIEVRHLQNKVAMLGRYPLARMPSFFSGADALLVSLRSDPIWSLTIPGKVQSYLMAGQPLVGMLDGEGARVVAQAGAGLIADAGDSLGLAQNVARLMGMSAELRRAMGQAGKAYGKREFDRNELVDALEGWIKECTSREVGTGM